DTSLPAGSDAKPAVDVAARWKAKLGRFNHLDRFRIMKMELRKTFQFEAAHLLPRLPRTHKCRRLHGHSFKVEIVVAGECDPKLGWLMDYADVSAAFNPIWRKLDHYHLND